MSRVNAFTRHQRHRAMYVCRGCGTEVYKDRFVRCPVCGIKWG
ncbi:DNA-directed RNA polymerase subunit RPC12/RpoP [Leifsonia sp. EB34]